MTTLFSSRNFLLPGLGAIVFGFFVLSMGRGEVSEICLTAALCLGILAIHLRYHVYGDWRRAIGDTMLTTVFGVIICTSIAVSVYANGLGEMFRGSYGYVAGAFIGLGAGMLALGMGFDFAAMWRKKPVTN